jgi:hypothetical protein
MEWLADEDELAGMDFTVAPVAVVDPPAATEFTSLSLRKKMMATARTIPTPTISPNLASFGIFRDTYREMGVIPGLSSESIDAPPRGCQWP